MEINSVKLVKDGWKFILLLLVTAAVLYSGERIVQGIFFIGLLVQFYRSKNNGFWIAYFFFVIMGAGGFFYSLTSNILVLSRINVSLNILFAIISFFKVVNSKAYSFRENIMWTPFKVWYAYLFFLIALGFLFFGNNGGGMSGLRYYYLTIQLLVVITFFYSIPKLLSSKRDLLTFSLLLFLTVFLNIVGQFWHIVYNEPIFERFVSAKASGDFADERDIFVRPIFGSFHCILAFSLAYYFMFSKERYFNKFFLQAIVFSSIISIMITATRGWMIAIILMLILIYLSSLSRFRVKVIASLFLLIGLFFITYSTSAIFKKQIDNSFERFSTLELILEGDLTAGGTNRRLTDRNDNVMELFYKSPIIGNGFSLEAMERNDQHVGNQNILMSGGIIGAIVILYWLLFTVKKIYGAHKQSLGNRYYSQELLIFIILMVGLFIVHSTSTSLFSFLAYVKSGGKLLFIALVFGVVNNVLLDNLRTRNTNIVGKNESL